MRRALMMGLALCLLMIGGCLDSGASSETEKEKAKEPYEVVTGYFLQEKRVEMLVTVASWTGSESREITYKAKKSPWVINYGYTPTSKLGSFFNVTVYKDVGGIGLTVVSFGETLVQEAGEFKINVEASGCDWWVKIGVEDD